MSTKTFLPIILSFNAGIGSDAGTQRWLYTVPAGKRAEVEYFNVAILQLNAETVALASASIRINSTNISIVFNTGVVGGIDIITYGNRISIDSGFTFDFITQNGTAAVQAFRGFAVIREFQ